MGNNTLFEGAGGVAAEDGVGGGGAEEAGTGAEDTAVGYGDAGTDKAVGGYPDVVTNGDGAADKREHQGGRVVGGCAEEATLRYYGIVADGDGGFVVEFGGGTDAGPAYGEVPWREDFATGVDEGVFVNPRTEEAQQTVAPPAAH